METHIHRNACTDTLVYTNKHTLTETHRYIETETETYTNRTRNIQKYSRHTEIEIQRNTHTNSNTLTEIHRQAHRQEHTYTCPEIDTYAPRNTQTQQRNTQSLTQSCRQMSRGQTHPHNHTQSHAGSGRMHTTRSLCSYGGSHRCPNLQQLSVHKALFQAALALGWMGLGWALSREAKDVGKENQGREDCWRRGQARWVFAEVGERIGKGRQKNQAEETVRA